MSENRYLIVPKIHTVANVPDFLTALSIPLPAGVSEDYDLAIHEPDWATLVDCVEFTGAAAHDHFGGFVAPVHPVINYPTGGVALKSLFISNLSTVEINLWHEDTNNVAKNRFSLPNNVPHIIVPNSVTVIVYRPDIERWWVR